MSIARISLEEFKMKIQESTPSSFSSFTNPYVPLLFAKLNTMLSHWPIGKSSPSDTRDIHSKVLILCTVYAADWSFRVAGASGC